jgi:hypothetical protein
MIPIIDLLKAKHHDAVCVPECKTGATVNGYHRFDLWVMEKSWAHPKIIGYEIKLSRSDFLNDKKWPRYLSYCNEFYFVCADGIADKRELPDEVGLLTVSKTGSRLFIRKKAPYRDITIDDDIFRYILMWRAKIDSEKSSMYIEFWKSWLINKKECNAIGHAVSKELNIRFHREIELVNRENERLKSQNEKLEEVKVLLEKNGVIVGWNSPERIVSELKKALLQQRMGIPENLKRCIQEIENTTKRANQIIADMEVPCTGS